jgi:hypothetical protein
MFRQTVAGVLCLIMAIQSVACHSMRPVELDLSEVPDPGSERIVGLTKVDGEFIYFDRAAAAVVRGDTVIGTGRPGSAGRFERAQPDEPGWEEYRVALADIDRLWVEHKRFDAWKTIGLTVGVTLGAAATAVAIIAATKESCPFVYSWNGSQYVFDAEPYGGAVTRGMERDDYAELENLRPDEGQYRLRLTNEVNETQYTNLTELWVADHPVGTRVKVDEWGGLHTVRSQQPPEAAVNAAGDDLLPWLAETDRRIWEPRPTPDAGGSLREDIVLTFPKPLDATSVKLVANVATGLWGSHMIREMLELRGNAIGKFYASVDSDPAQYDSILGWSLREDLYLLQLLVEEPTGWELRGVLPGGGPFIAEDLVVLLDVRRVEGEVLRLRLRPTPGFWALNSFAVDYGDDLTVHVDTVAAQQATDSYGRDVLSQLLEVDGEYHDMPQTGDWAEVSFPAPAPVNGMSRTVFLHSRGYYRLHLTEGGTPDTTLVREIQEVPGAAAQFAADRYAELQMAKANRR